LSERKALAKDIADSLAISGSIKSVFIEEVDSPWNEKAMIKRKKQHLEVKLTLWKGEPFLYGRIYRLFLYLHDVLNPAFLYSSKKAPEEDKEPRYRDRYNQIWSLYVDSRMEKMALENFFDKKMRQNLFIDVERDLSWQESTGIFERLWNKDAYTHPEILHYTYHLDELRDQVRTSQGEAIEVRLNDLLKETTVRRHLDRIGSDPFRAAAEELLNFTAYHCKDTIIEASYYGISFLYQRKIFVEIIPTDTDLLYFTIYNPRTGGHETHRIRKGADLKDIEETIKACYRGITMHEERVQ
jgi:hypothetical protein